MQASENTWAWKAVSDFSSRGLQELQGKADPWFIQLNRLPVLANQNDQALTAGFLASYLATILGSWFPHCKAVMIMAPASRKGVRIN